MATLKFTYLFNERNNVLFKAIAELLQLAICLFRMTEYLTKKLPVPTKRVTFISIKVKSRNALLRMLLVCIRSYLKSVLRYKFLIFDTYHPYSTFT